jgi:hypothetical protein
MASPVMMVHSLGEFAGESSAFCKEGMTIPSGAESARPFPPTKDFDLGKALYEAQL